MFGRSQSRHARFGARCRSVDPRRLLNGGNYFVRGRLTTDSGRRGYGRGYGLGVTALRGGLGYDNFVVNDLSLEFVSDLRECGASVLFVRDILREETTDIRRLGRLGRALVALTLQGVV